VRLLNERLYGGDLQLDATGRIRIDDWEMAPEIQAAVEEIWPKITSESLTELSDFEGYQKNFLNLFGFEIDGVDYEAEVEVDLPMPSIG
jgi:enoyl-[acyl-carrier protein] reductase/trans-2-enoyl-CoA reductase (NAD+)